MTIRVRGNQANRTFTIRRYDQNKVVYAKYRTGRQSIPEFQDMCMWTEGDWQAFLNYSQDYQKI